MPEGCTDRWSFDGLAISLFCIAPASNPSLPASTAYLKAFAIFIGSCAKATAEFKSTPSYPSSIAKIASDGFPIPASTIG